MFAVVLIPAAKRSGIMSGLSAFATGSGGHGVSKAAQQDIWDTTVPPDDEEGSPIPNLKESQYSARLAAGYFKDRYGDIRSPSGLKVGADEAHAE